MYIQENCLFCNCYIAHIGSDCSEPVNQLACNKIDFAECGANSTCECKGTSKPSHDKKRCAILLSAPGEK